MNTTSPWPTASSSSTTASSAATSVATSPCETPFCKLDLDAPPFDGLRAGAAPVEWGVPPDEFVFGEHEVHLWRFSLDRDEAVAAEFFDLLAPDERTRARRFFFAENRRRYIVGRGLLRRILGRYLDADPAQLAFRYGPQGKPYLAGPLCFNLAHTETLALIAVAHGHAVGVDLERVRPIADADTVASRFFSPREQTKLRDAPAAQRAETFLRLWTDKEACAKAVGRGLDDNLADLEVIDFEHHAAHRVDVADETGRTTHCLLAEFPAAPDHVAAVALACDETAHEVALTA